MGRVGEVITRTWQTTDKMKRQRGQLLEDPEEQTRLSVDGNELAVPQGILIDNNMMLKQMITI